jgi:HAMP domain-containing protein
MARLSIRLKLLVVFMALFGVVLGGIFYWFYRFATQLAMEDLRQSLVTAAITASYGIDPAEHTQLIASGAEDDEIYTEIADGLRQVRDADERMAAVYTAVRSPNAGEVLLGVTSEEKESPERSTFLERYDASQSPAMLAGFEQPAADDQPGSDAYGTWLSGFAPIPGTSGETAAIVGVDMDANEVSQIQAQIRAACLLAFAVALLAVFAAAWLLSDAITRPLRAISSAAQALEQGEAFQPEGLAQTERRADELGQLARVFSRMAVQVQAREQKLKEEVKQLRIEIDETKRKKQVDEIVDSEFFRDLQGKAGDMRRRRSGGEAKD